MKQNLISIIIPAYNVEKYIVKCLESVSTQTYPNIEIIVVNDGSTDATETLIKSCIEKDSRISCISQKNAGLPAARNQGLKHANGEFIMFLDSDDWLEKKCCEISLNAIKENNADVVIFDYYKIIKNKKFPYNSYSQKFIEFDRHKSSSPFIYDMRSITAWGKLYRATSIKNILFDETMRTAEDVDFNFRVYNQVHKTIYIQEYLLNYRILDSSAIHGYDNNIYEKMMHPLQKIRQYMLSDNQKIAYYSFVAIAYMLICQNGICLNPDISLKKKYQSIKELGKKQLFNEMFQNSKKLVLPSSRKLFILSGKYHFYCVIILMVLLKKRFKNL